MLNQMAQSEGTKAMVVTLETSMGHVHVVGERIINQKTIASKMQDVTSVTCKGIWQKCACQSNQAPQHPYTNVYNKLIILRRLQLVTLTFLFSDFMISRRNHLLWMCVFKVPTLLLDVNTGAAVTLFSVETYREHFPNMPMQETSLQLTMYSKDKLKV